MLRDPMQKNREFMRDIPRIREYGNIFSATDDAAAAFFSLRDAANILPDGNRLNVLKHANGMYAWYSTVPDDHLPQRYPKDGKVSLLKTVMIRKGK